MNNVKVVTFGEIMLRLKSPAYERLMQSPVLEATFGGGEANVSVSLANYGLNTSFVTVLPDNDSCTSPAAWVSITWKPAPCSVPAR